jgi:transcription initiation factor TFIIIB Brf1 subunit/transcription initiation factor TFIIB
MIKEGKIFIEIVCANCGAVIKNGWSWHPKENEKTKWTCSCSVCKMPVEVEFVIN